MTAEGGRASGSVVGRGDWLIRSLEGADAAQADWLLALAEFDRLHGWALDGQLSCVSWLAWRGRMARSTAYEKVQVARQLAERRLLADALREGRVSYSVARVMARMADPDPDVDAAVIDAAASLTVRDVERLVDAYGRHADQHRRARDIAARRGVRVRPNFDGTTTIEITLDDLEAADYLAVLDAFEDSAVRSAPADGDEDMAGVSGAGVSGAGVSGAEVSARADSSDRGDEVSARVDTFPAGRRADAAMDMARTAVKHLGEGAATSAERYMVHVVSTDGEVALLDGTSLDEATAGRLGCDSSGARLLVGEGWEPLAMGRRTRTWTAAQRRAVMIRDAGRCRFPGCANRHYVDVHHHRSWEQGGPTDVSNAILLCSAHHRLLHQGWTASGHPDHQLIFYRPDGTILASTSSVSAPKRTARPVGSGAPSHTP